MESDNLTNGVSAKSSQSKAAVDGANFSDDCRGGSTDNRSIDHELSGCALDENGMPDDAAGARSRRCGPSTAGKQRIKKKLGASTAPEAEQFDGGDSDNEHDEVDHVSAPDTSYTYHNGDGPDCNGLSSSSRYHDDESSADSLERAKIVPTSHKNLIRKKRFLESSLNGANEVSPSYSQSFDCSSKLSGSSKTGIRKKESMRANRQCNSVEFRAGYDPECSQSRSNAGSLDDTHSSTESVAGERSNAACYQLATHCDGAGAHVHDDISMPSGSSANFSGAENSLPGNSSGDCEAAALNLKKPFKLPSLVNLFEAAKAQQRIDLAESASALSEAASGNDPDLDEGTGLDLEPGSSYSSEGSNSDTESQRISKPHPNLGSKKVSVTVRWYNLWSGWVTCGLFNDEGRQPWLLSVVIF